LPQEAVEVEQRRCGERVDIVLAIESIEHLDDGDQRIVLAKLEWTLQSPIKREILIVLSGRIPVRRCPGPWRDRSYLPGPTAIRQR
jgi:hypothetical protein